MERDIQTDSALPEVLTLREDLNQSRLDRYRRDLESAQGELDEERHKPLGLFDDLLNLLCWIETPEERLHKNQLAQITMREVGGSKPPQLMGSLAQRVILALAKAV